MSDGIDQELQILRAAVARTDEAHREGFMDDGFFPLHTVSGRSLKHFVAVESRFAQAVELLRSINELSAGDRPEISLVMSDIDAFLGSHK